MGAPLAGSSTGVPSGFNIASVRVHTATKSPLWSLATDCPANVVWIAAVL